MKTKVIGWVGSPKECNALSFGKLVDGGFLGRNGWGNSQGLTAMRLADTIHICPITSKDREARCTIVIPDDRMVIRKFVSVLEQVHGKQLVSVWLE